jgi:hypothetical protein
VTLSPEQFHQQAMDIINRSNDVLRGADARTVFKAANIRSWPMQDMPTQIREGWSREYQDSISPDETLHTAQQHLHAPTLKKYLAGDVPETDPEYDYEDNPEPVPYLPETVVSESGRRWIDEGHHRIVASRLRGDVSTDVWGGPLFAR